jgi:5-methylcytosine-specific restriction enzyme A
VSPRRKTLGVCLEPDCGELTLNRRCPAHERENVKRNRSVNNALYASRRWRILRTRYLAHHSECVECGQPASEVDHITPIEVGGPVWDQSNWAAMCHACHSRKTLNETRNR